MTAAGFPAGNVQVAASRTPTGLDADAVEVGVRDGEGCLVGQVRNGTVNVILPAGPGGRAVPCRYSGARNVSYPGRATRFVGMAEFIYTMTKARKAVGEKLILDDVSMSFFPGAKIGVVGPNGAGKSTILKIMAGLDTPSNGEARLSPGYTVGILLQEPPLNEDKTVLGNVQEGVGEIYRQDPALQRDLRRDGQPRR